MRKNWYPSYNQLIKLDWWNVWKLQFSWHRRQFRKFSSLSIYGTALFQNEKGIVTAVALLLVAVLTLMGTTAVIVTSTDIQISGNYRVGEIAFYAAEAGVEEARGRLRSTAGVNQINDTHPISTEWRAYIGDLVMAQKLGFQADLATHSRTDSLQASINYVVEIRHRTDNAGNIVYWGDDNNDGVVTRNTIVGNSNNRTIYLVTSAGYTGNSYQQVEVEMVRALPISVPAPLYVKANTEILGSSTDIIGVDGCGGSDKPGIVTTKNPGSVSMAGNPNITGAGGTTPNITYNGVDLDIDGMVNSLKTRANYSYNVNNATHTGMNWGTPTLGALESPSTCSTQNIVYYNTNDTTIELTGGSSGCGILLVEGDLTVHGGFTWHGLVIVTKSITYTGGGNKQVTGGMLAGGTVDADVIGGNANIVYCSSAVDNQTASLPLSILSWRDLRVEN